MRAATQWADAERFWREREARAGPLRALWRALAEHARRDHRRALLAEHGGHCDARLQARR